MTKENELFSVEKNCCDLNDGTMAVCANVCVAIG